MIDIKLKDLIRKAYKAGRRNALKQDEANLNDFINKHESELKLFAIPNVVGRSEQLKAFADYAQKRMWEDGDKDLSDFVDEFLRL